MMADEYYDGAYTGEEIDAAVAKANAAAPQSTTYTKPEVDSALAGKADASHTHTMSQITDLGAAAAKEVDSTPTSSSTNLVESGGVYAALGAKVSLRDILGYGTVIPASTEENPQDLDTYASMGVFTIESSAVAATIDNAPVVFPGRLFVFAGAVAGANIQVYITGENLYIRRRTSTLEWKPWVSMI